MFVTSCATPPRPTASSVGALLVPLFILFLIAGGGASPARGQGRAVKIDGSSVGRTIPLRVGDTLQITLKANAGGNYFWHVAQNDPTVLRPVSPLGAPDGSGNQILQFRAVGPGGGQLSLLYHEPGKPNSRPLDTFQAFVLVDQGTRAKKVMVRDADNNGQVTLDLGDTLVVRLTANAGTGYSWGVASNNPLVLRPLGSTLVPPASGMPGGRTEQELQFRAAGLGGQTLILVYRRPGNAGANTSGTTSFNLNVWVVPVTGLPLPTAGVTLWDNDSGRQVPVRVGDTVTVRLTANPSTGYSWNLAGGGPPPLLQLQGTPRNEQTGGNVVGAPSTQVYRFRVVSAGQGVLRLLYQRPWENGIQAARKWEVTLTATP
jgi:predicted secreted protein